MSPAPELERDVPIAVLASAVWDTPNPVNAHQIARRLAACGHRVLFVDSSGIRAPAPLRSAHDRRRIVARLASARAGPRRVTPNLDVLSPLTLPAGWPEPWRSLSAVLLARSVRRAARAAGLARPVVWAMLPTQLRAARALAPRLLVYHAVDDYAANPGVDADWLRAREREMLAAADLVFAASPQGAERLRAQRPDVRLLANVADVELFSRALLEDLAEPAALSGRQRQRAVYVGNLATYRFDFRLLCAAARARRDVDFVLVGPLGLGESRDPDAAARELACEPNVVLLGPLPQEQLPAVLAHCRVALLPLLDNAHTRAAMPLKLWEYLAAGLPVVARDLPNLRELADERAIRLYRDDATFAEALDAALREPEEGRAARLALARAHDWGARIAEIRRLLAQALASRAGASPGRTLLLARGFAPQVGGVQVVLDELARRWPGELRVIALATPGDAEHDAAYPRPVRRIRSYEGWPGPLAVALRQLAYLRATSALWREWRFERIVCGYLATHGPVALWWRLRRRTPFVVLTYGMELVSAERSPAAPLYRWILERAELVATIAEPFSDLVKRLAPGARVRKIPLGCRTLPAASRSAAEAVRPELAGRRVVLSVGRLEPRKGFDLVLRALPRLLAEGRDLAYVAVGAGPDRPRLEQLARELGVSARVIFTGRIDDAELAGLYARADVFAMPSREEGASVEGFGLVYLEAGAAGVPVIGGRSGGVGEVVHEGGNGLLVDPLDAEALAAAIGRVLDDPALAARYGAEGRRLAREVFTFAAMCSALVVELEPGAPRASV